MNKKYIKLIYGKKTSNGMFKPFIKGYHVITDCNPNGWSYLTLKL